MRRLLQQISPTINVKQLDTDFSVSESLASSATARQSTNCNSNCVSCNGTVSVEKLSGISKSCIVFIVRDTCNTEMAQNSNEIHSSNELS